MKMDDVNAGVRPTGDGIVPLSSFEQISFRLFRKNYNEYIYLQSYNYGDAKGP